MSQWLEDAIFYEIYPQSFYDSNGDGIGDIPGITAKLDYIRELGCNALWLNPCFLSPFGDAGYDVADYCLVAPRYGTNDDLIELFRTAHAKGMHVLLDLVPGHTSVEHRWFKESCKAEKNPYSGRYIWTNAVWDDVARYEGIAGSLRGISERDGSVAVNFFSMQPALNYGFATVTEPWQCAVDSPEALATRQAMKDVMAFWLDRGCDGFRADMAGSLVKNDPGNEQTIRLWQDMRAYLDEHYPDAVMVSEWGEADKSLRAGFHMDFLLHFGPSHYMDLFRCEHPYFSREGKGDIHAFVKAYRKNYELTSGKGLICPVSGNHDMQRMRKYLDPEEMKIAFAFLLSMPGAPFIYYGDEIGMRQLDLPSKEGGYERTGARTPMQWDGSGNAGFSTAEAGKLYLPQDPAADAPDAAAQQAQEGSLWREVQKLNRVRHTTPALQAHGGIEFVYCQEDEYPLAYLRTAGRQRVLVIVNPAARETKFLYDGKLGKALYTLNGAPSQAHGIVTVPAASAAFVEVE